MIKLIHHYFQGRWRKHYVKSHWHLVLDLSLTIVIIFLIAIFIGLYFFRPSFPNFRIYKSPVVNLNNPPLVLDFSVDQTVISSAISVPLRISFKNNGAVSVNSVSITLNLLNDNFTITKINLASSSVVAKLDGQELILDKIAGGEDGIVDLQVYFSAKNSGKRTIDWQAQSQYNFNRQLFKANKTLTTLKIAAQLNASSGAYYTSPQGDQLGIGPVPPIVGIPTNYWVFWEVNSPSDFKDLIFDSRLPQGVELEAGRSLLSGEFNYNSSTRQLIWKVPEIKGGTNVYRLGFEIRITPSLQQLGQVISLLNASNYRAVDVLTGKTVSGELGGLTTNLEADSFNSGQGKVINQ